MEATAEQMELIGDFPLQRVRKRSLLRQFSDAYEKHGSLIPQNMISRLLGVSRERVSALIREERLAVVKIDDRNFVPWDSFKYFCSEERKHGRPVSVHLPARVAQVADGVSAMVKK
jgi:hypothetical protein